MLNLSTENLEQLIETSSPVQLIHQDRSGFTSENNSFRLTYWESAEENQMEIYVLSNPVVAFRGYVDMEIVHDYACFASQVLSLDSDPKDNSNCGVIAETEFTPELTLEDLGGDKKVYDFVKNLQNISKNRSGLTQAQKGWYEQANNMMYAIAQTLDFYQTYCEWYKEYHFKPKNSLKDKLINFFS